MDKIKKDTVGKSRWFNMEEHMGRKLTADELIKLEYNLMLYGSVSMDKDTGEIKGYIEESNSK